MSMQGEQEIRGRLSGLLDHIEPGPAPVASAVHRGRAIRRRRLVGAAAGLAVIVATVALLPGLLQAPHSVSPLGHLRDKVTIEQPKDSWRSGILAAGVTDGHHWQVVASGPRTSPMITFRGVAGLGFSDGAVPSGWPADLNAETSGGARGYSAIFGTVAPKVTSIVVRLPNGARLRLTPVAWKGSRWVGLVLPAGLRISRAIAYSHDRELAYAVPFGDVGLNVWWPPGQAGPARVTKVIGSGAIDGVAWRVTARIGPWGYCYTYGHGSDCSDSTSSPEVVPASKLVAGISCGPVTGSAGPSVGIAAARTSIRTVVLQFSGGSSASFPTVSVSGGRVFAYVIPRHVSVTSTREYNAAGRLVGTTSGSGWRPC